ncbi:MAG: hypothetical protein KIS67_17405 [Verrucomicrobiae bacterium]|nr:hypothetical protein [Verrucomicrobiae bacterium]
MDRNQALNIRWRIQMRQVSSAPLEVNPTLALQKFTHGMVVVIAPSLENSGYSGADHGEP